MKWAADRLLKNRKVFFLISGLVISLLLAALGFSQRAFVCKVIQTAFYTPFLSISSKLTQLLEVYDVNIELQSEIVRLKLERNNYLESKLENERFRGMLRFLPRLEYETIPAFVVAYDQGRRLSSVVIKGSEVLEQSLPVVDESGLVGKISAVTGKTATVSLLVGPNCRVAARDQQTRSLGIIKWQSQQSLYFDHVSLENEVFIGDTLISSGLGGVFPEGLIVGVVASVDTIPSKFFKNIEVIPAVNFGALDNVMVLKPVNRPDDS